MVKPDKNIDKLKTQKQLLVLGALVFLLLIAGAYFAFAYISENSSSQNIKVEKKHIIQSQKPSTKTSKGQKSDEISKKGLINQKAEEIAKEGTEDLKQEKQKNGLKDSKVDKKTISSNTESIASVDKAQQDDKKEKEPGQKFSESNKLLKDILDEAQKDTDKTKQTYDSSSEIDLLDQMPEKKLYKESVFQKGTNKYIRVQEENLDNLVSNAKKQMGRIEPFNSGGKNSLKKSLDDFSKSFSNMMKSGKGNQSIKPPTGINKLSDIIPPPPDLRTFKPYNTSSIEQLPKFSMENSAQALLDKTEVTGILGNAAVLSINGVSRALQSGQNYKGIVVLSVSSNSVVLKASGVKVTKYLRD